jgi:hypothetical protein
VRVRACARVCVRVCVCVSTASVYLVLALHSTDSDLFVTAWFMRGDGEVHSPPTDHVTVCAVVFNPTLHVRDAHVLGRLRNTTCIGC